jgi:hypothetical protein
MNEFDILYVIPTATIPVHTLYYLTPKVGPPWTWGLRLNNDDTSEEVNVDQARLQFMVELVEYVDKLKVDALDSTCVNPMYTGRTPAAQPAEQRHVLMETWNMERKNTMQPATTRSP